MATTHAGIVTLCTVQPAIVWNQPEETFAHIAALLAEAAGQTQLDVVVLPEHFNATEETEGDSAQWHAAQVFAADLARRHAVNLVAGSVERWDSTLGARVNTAVVYDRTGQELGQYDKRRLFGFERRRNVQPGERALIVSLDGIPCGVLICADLWFPEQVRELAATVDLLCVPAQTTIRAESQPAYARMLWQTLAMTRSQENVLALAVSDQAASSQAPFRCGGVASITDPSAEPDPAAMQRTLKDGAAGYLIAPIDIARLRRFRAYRRENGLLPPLV
jgi:predicted amidohydrolase